MITLFLLNEHLLCNLHCWVSEGNNASKAYMHGYANDPADKLPVNDV